MAQRSTEAPRFGIRARLLILLLPAVLALLALDSWNDYRALHNVVQEAYDQALLEPVVALADSLDRDASGAITLKPVFAVQAMFDATRPAHKHLHVGLTPLRDGRETGPEISLVGSPDLPDPPTPPSTAGADPYAWYDGVHEGYPVRIVALRRTVTDGRGQAFRLLVQAAEGTGAREQAQAASLRQELLRDGRMLVVVLALVWVGVSFSLRPLQHLRASVLASPADRLVPLDASRAPYEVAPLVDAINHHIDSHRRMLGKQSQFLADASHQLRTPLAIMLTQAAYALREPDAPRMHEALGAIAAQLSRSRRLSEQLLALAHAGQTEGDTPPAARVDLNRIAREVVLQYLPLAHEKEQDLGWVDVRGDDAAGSENDSDIDAEDTAMAAPVIAHANELHEALSNLVHNAIHYTPVGGRITVTVRLQAGSACAEVCDSGPGIAAHRRERVFERFQDGAPRDADAPQGAGLGLAIARAYARHNQGDILLSDAVPDGPAGGTGLCATLQLPLATA